MTLLLANAIPTRESRLWCGFSRPSRPEHQQTTFCAGRVSHALASSCTHRPLAALLHRLACSATAPSGAALPSCMSESSVPSGPTNGRHAKTTISSSCCRARLTLRPAMRLGELDGRTSATSARPYAVYGKCSRASIPSPPASSLRLSTLESLSLLETIHHYFHHLSHLAC